jgi:hypothetical protein
MFKTLFGSAAVLLILIFALVAPAGVANAQQAGQTPAAADPAPAEPAADPAANSDALSDEEIRQILTNQSAESFASWKKRRGYINAKECSDYNGVDGPNKPHDVYCDPADIPAEQVELYRETQRQKNATFLNEPPVKF